MLFNIVEGDWEAFQSEEVPDPNVQDHESTLGHHGMPAEAEHSIAYSNYTHFPLTSLQYAGECWKLNQEPHSHGAFWDAGIHGVQDVSHNDSRGTCSSSITYMLDGEVGLVADLALMAQVAGLARSRNRTFFVDDTYWDRGKWSDYFEDVDIGQPGPEPGCRSPPPEELVACPRLARHWVVTSRTAKFHFTHDFVEEFEDPYKMAVERKRPMLETGRESFLSAFRLNNELQSLVTNAQSQLGTGPYMSVHIRRGDQNAMSWKYHTGYVPIGDYVDAVKGAWAKLAVEPEKNGVKLYVAADDPEALREFLEQVPEDWKTFSLLVDGDEQLARLASNAAYDQATWDEAHDTEQKAVLTKGMLVDLAMVGGGWPVSSSGPIATVCTLSSNVCKVSAMLLGWQKAFVEKRWVEIDNKGSIEPEWEPFTLYH